MVPSFTLGGYHDSEGIQNWSGHTPVTRRGSSQEIGTDRLQCEGVWSAAVGVVHTADVANIYVVCTVAVVCKPIQLIVCVRVYVCTCVRVYIRVCRLTVSSQEELRNGGQQGIQHTHSQRLTW